MNECSSINTNNDTLAPETFHKGMAKGKAGEHKD